MNYRSLIARTRRVLDRLSPLSEADIRRAIRAAEAQIAAHARLETDINALVDRSPKAAVLVLHDWMAEGRRLTAAPKTS